MEEQKNNFVFHCNPTAVWLSFVQVQMEVQVIEMWVNKDLGPTVHRAARAASNKI